MKVPRGPANIVWPIYLAIVLYAVPLLVAGVAGDDPAFKLYALIALPLGFAAHIYWLRHVARGRKMAVILAYIVHLPCFFLILSMLTFLALPYVVDHMVLAGLLLFVVTVFIIFLFVLNVLSPGLLPWLKLDARCPACLNWRYARGKPGTTETCEECGAEISFHWAE